MRFLIDEDVPVKLIGALAALGYDAIRVPPSTHDPDIARQAARQRRTLITLDKDFANRLLYPPASFNIICIRIHPPFADDLIAALELLLRQSREEDLRGLIVLERDGHTRIAE